LTEPTLAKPEGPSAAERAEFNRARPGAAPRRVGLWQRMCRGAALFWLDTLFFFSLYWPWFANSVKRFFVWGCFTFSKAIRTATRANARRILGPDAEAEAVEELARGMAWGFYEFISDMGVSLRLDHEQLVEQIDQVEGKEAYIQARESSTGAILLTGHLGSFEIGLTALRQYEEHIHVVFHPDQSGLFERMRSKQRKQLGVIEAPVDRGLAMWMELRQALQDNHVVLMQGDRVLGAQKGVTMPFCHGHIEMPTGPIKLALASGSPIFPVFALRQPDGKVRIFLEQAIDVQPGLPIDDQHPAMVQIARSIEKYVKLYPKQWHLFHRAFCEDQPNSSPD